MRSVECVAGRAFIALVFAASALAQTALTLRPDYANARYNLAEALAKYGHLDEALKNFTALVAANPNDAEVHSGFGELLLRMNRRADALEQFNKALALDPLNKAASENVARARAPSAAP